MMLKRAGVDLTHRTRLRVSNISQKNTNIHELERRK